MSAMEHWYVYYKCPRAALGETIARVRSMQAALAAGRLVQSKDDGDRTTLMEIYEHIDQPEGFAVALDDAIARSGLPAELRSARHTERFQDT